MRIAILGYGDQGKSAYEYWSRQGHEITICDHSEELGPPEDANQKLGKDYLKNLDDFDLLIRSPSIHPSQILQANTPNVLDKVTTVTNEFFKVCPSKHVIGITGTKGKGTTSTLIAKMLEAAGNRVHLGGNIGIPPLELLKNDIKPTDWVVLELANFQLIDLKHSPQVGVALMIEPEHMDWHTDMVEYVAAKQKMFESQKPNDIAIYFADNRFSRQAVEVSAGEKIPYFAKPGAVVENGTVQIAGQEIIKTAGLKLLGRHNWQNVCAAVTAVWQITQDHEAIKKVLAEFSGLPHRLEFVREVGGVKYYDDSFGTTPSTAQVAIQAFNEPKVVILGGSDKGAKYDELAKAVVENNVKVVIVIGKTGRSIAENLSKLGYNSIVQGGKSMDEIMEYASQLASSGDVVLLSPACASFDMFKNYKHRGEEFKKAVEAL